MKREILFRGKTGKGKWIYGHYCPCVVSGFPAVPCIIGKERLDNGCWEPIQVIPESVGQFTGLTDKNGKKIFEGDIVIYQDYDKLCFRGFVEYLEEIAMFVARFEFGLYFFANMELGKIEVIGNIFDKESDDGY